MSMRRRMASMRWSSTALATRSGQASMSWAARVGSSARSRLASVGSGRMHAARSWSMGPRGRGVAADAVHVIDPLEQHPDSFEAAGHSGAAQLFLDKLLGCGVGEAEAGL